VITIYGTCKAISHDKRFVPLRQYYPKDVCSAQYGYFMQLLDVLLSRRAAQTFSNYFEALQIDPTISSIKYIFLFH
jgi:hypothetical protein